MQLIMLIGVINETYLLHHSSNGLLRQWKQAVMNEEMVSCTDSQNSCKDKRKRKWHLVTAQREQREREREREREKERERETLESKRERKNKDD